MNGSRKECMGSMWEKRKVLTGIELGSGLQKEIWKDVLRPWYVAPWNKVYYTRFHIDLSAESPLCRMRGSKGETVAHVVRECGKRAQTEYKGRHDSVALYIHWQLRGKCGLERANSWYKQRPEWVVESENFKILWDFTVQCDWKIEARRRDIVFIDNKERGSHNWLAIPGDDRVKDKELEKLEIYQLLKDEIASLAHAKSHCSACCYWGPWSRTSQL